MEDETCGQPSQSQGLIPFDLQKYAISLLYICWYTLTLFDQTETAYGSYARVEKANLTRRRGGADASITQKGNVR